MSGYGALEATVKERDAARKALARQNIRADKAEAEVERLKHDIARHVQIATDLNSEVERLKGVLQRLGSAEAFDMARTLDAKDAELIMRMDFARSALEAKP